MNVSPSRYSAKLSTEYDLIYDVCRTLGIQVYTSCLRFAFCILINVISVRNNTGRIPSYTLRQLDYMQFTLFPLPG
jgi:hypothetical protein